MSDKAVYVELYRGEAPGSVGVELHEWDGVLDAETTEWLTSQGWGTDNPDLWVNVVAEDAWTPDNRPVAQRRMVLPS